MGVLGVAVLPLEARCVACGETTRRVSSGLDEHAPCDARRSVIQRWEYCLMVVILLGRETWCRDGRGL
jgi:hypothetical protein